MLAFFWQQDPLNGFSQNGLYEFSVCKRIEDFTEDGVPSDWYSNLLDECRAGNLSDDAYNFLHGYPTRVCGSQTKSNDCSVCQSALTERMKGLLQQWQTATKELDLSTGQQLSTGQELSTRTKGVIPVNGWIPQRGI